MEDSLVVIPLTFPPSRGEGCLLYFEPDVMHLALDVDESVRVLWSFYFSVST